VSSGHHNLAYCQLDLFDSSATLTPIPIKDGELAFLPRLPLPLSNDEILARLIAETEWREETIVVYGKRHLQPRLTAWYGDAGYTYSGLRLAPLPFTPLLSTMHAAVEQVTQRHFNSVLLNYYRNEHDSVGMHADDEPELGPEPAIASLSFGATRRFVLRHRRSGETHEARPDGRQPLADGWPDAAALAPRHQQAGSAGRPACQPNFSVHRLTRPHLAENYGHPLLNNKSVTLHLITVLTGFARC
jgi:alkylated DNA repair dioxygenase AlkB